DDAHEILRRLGEMAVHRYVSPYHLALIHCNLGDREMALALLQEALSVKDGWLVWLGVEPQLDTLRDDARFQELLRKTRNPAAFRSGAVPAESEQSGRHPAESPSGPHPAGQRPSESGEAYQLYVAARYHERKRTAEGLREAIARYERAVEIDPRFAHAYANLSECYSLLNWYVEPPPADAWSRAREAAAKAVGIDDELADAHSALGFVRFHYERDHAAAEESFRRAISLDPGSPPARRWHAMNLSAMGRHAEAIAEIRRAQELSPRSAVIATATANILYFARRYEDAAAQARKALEMDPGSVAARVVLRWAYECQNMRDAAMAVYEEERAFAGDTPTTRAKHAHTLAACGRHDEARAVIKELLAGKDGEGVTPYELAVVYSLLGEREEGINWLERAEKERVVGFTFARVDPHLDNLRDDPRFAELMRRATPRPGAAAGSNGRGPAERTVAFTVHTTTPDPTPPAAPKEEKAEEVEKVEKVEDEREAVVSPPPPERARPTGRRLVFALVALAAVAGVSVPLLLYLRGASRATADSRPVQLTSHPATDWQPAYSPDGSTLVFASKRDGNFEIYAAGADGSAPVRLTDSPNDDLMPAYSPDGGRVAFTSKRDGNDEVYVMGADGSNPTNLTRSPSADSRPSWSPDGSRLLFVSNRDGDQDSFDIYSVNADGTGLKRLTDDKAHDGDPAWSPDGSRIAFASNRGGDFDVYVMDADGRSQTNVTRNPSFDGKPAWSPDGKKIAFTSNRGEPGDPDIYVMEASGAKTHKVWDNDATDDEPAWSPDGSTLVYQSEADGNVDVYVISSDAVAAEKAPAPGVRSVAVLPFKTPGASGDEQYLGVGLAEAVSGKLGQLGGLTARPASAVRRYLGTDKTPADAGRELGADYVLTGTIERNGDRVMTALELTDVAAGRVLWSERLEELFTDITTLQTSVSERVARALDIQLTRAERARLQKRSTDNGEAYALYLAGRYHMGKRTPDGLRHGITNFEQAISRDPSLAVAYSGLADSYTLLNWYVEPPPAGAFARAKEAATKAVQLDEQQAESHVSLGFVTFYFDRDLEAAERHFRRALALNPNYATAHHWFALVLSAAGRHEEALAEIGRAQELDPRSGVIATAAANILYYARRYDEAISQCEKALGIDPGSAGAYTTMRWAYTLKGMHSQALAVYNKERAFAGDTPLTRLKHAHVLASSGRAPEARAVLRELVAKRDKEWVTPHDVGVVYALLGEREEAVSWLARAAREHATGFAFAGVDPQLDSLREDPSFKELLRTSGVSR
ncbi:MAG TPA: tetratricopeptide repeat protein, partial [Pyrinomonadaceae bacterium]|nr:tetratricopeptide repeat protein [Pyrinomonadaceae bacterium]